MIDDNKQAITETQKDDQGNKAHDLPNTNFAAGTLFTNPGDFHGLGLAKTFATETLPGLIYLHLLLRLPYLYFSRVDKIFLDAQLSMSEIKQMALRVGANDGDSLSVQTEEGVPRAYLRLKVRWEELVDALMEEWKTLNIISVLLLG